MKMMKLWVFLAVSLLFHKASLAWILPGTVPQDHEEGAPITIQITSLSSVLTQLPYDYYSTPYPKPKYRQQKHESLGAALLGEKAEASPYVAKMRENSTCLAVAPPKILTENEKRQFMSLIDNGYLVNWTCEELPGLARIKLPSGQLVSRIGTEVGEHEEKYLLYNHLTFILKYHQPYSDKKEYRVVGFEVQRRSIQHSKTRYLQEDIVQHTYEAVDASPANDLPEDFNDEESNIASPCDERAPPFYLNDNEEVTFTYDIVWENSDQKWASRWDTYLHLENAEIHWFSIINGLIIVAFVSGLVAVIVARTLARDIAFYNDPDPEDLREDGGWKLIHADVFRKPKNFRILCAFLGTGVQILGIFFAVLIFSMLGLISPKIRGNLLNALFFLFAFMGFPAGYTAGRFSTLYPSETNKNRYYVPLATTLVFPGFSFGIFFVLNFIVWLEGSSASLPFTSLLLILLVWFGVSTPLVFWGFKFGQRRPPFTVPVKTTRIPRSIPKRTFLKHPFLISLLGGILPFGTAFTEVFFILTSIWFHQFYYLFGFLFLVLIMVGITAAEISIVFTYFQLAGENHKWWWHSFFTAASSALYVFAYSILYYNSIGITKLVSTILYFGYMLIFSSAFFLLTGCLGFFGSFWFVRAMYSSIKVD